MDRSLTNKELNDGVAEIVDARTNTRCEDQRLGYLVTGAMGQLIVVRSNQLSDKPIRAEIHGSVDLFVVCLPVHGIPFTRHHAGE